MQVGAMELGLEPRLHREVIPPMVHLGEQLSAWPNAEQKLRLATLRKPTPTHAAIAAQPPRPIDNAPFIAAPSFTGAVPGYVFTTRDSGTGYYIDTGDALPRPPVLLSLCTLITEEICVREACSDRRKAPAKAHPTQAPCMRWCTGITATRSGCRSLRTR